MTNTLRDSLKANLFDGDDGGRVTQDVSSLLDDIVEAVALWFIDQSGARDQIDAYYEEPVNSTPSDRFASFAGQGTYGI